MGHGGLSIDRSGQLHPDRHPNHRWHYLQFSGWHYRLHVRWRSLLRVLRVRHECFSFSNACGRVHFLRLGRGVLWHRILFSYDERGTSSDRDLRGRLAYGTQDYARRSTPRRSETTMKLRLASLALIFFAATSLFAQAATRPATLAWTPPSGTPLNYTVFNCPVPSGGTSCSPNTSGTPLATVTSPTYTTTLAVGSAYGWTVVANYPACSATSPLTSPCGGGGSVTIGYYPVPPQGQGSTSLLIQIP